MTRIYIDKKAIERIKAGGRHEPCIVIADDDCGKVTHAHTARVKGETRFVHDHSRTEGPTVWAETNDPVVYR